MTQYRVAHPVGQKWLAWLLLVAVALMGLTITRQQALGSLHSHADQGPRIASALSAAVSNLGNNWINRWQQQQVFRHGSLRSGAASDSNLWPSDSASMANSTRSHVAHAHDHDALERHHHAAHDASVIALDSAAELANAVDSPATGALVLQPGLGAPSAGPVLPDIAAQKDPWPVRRLVAFVSRSVPPLLRPPSL